MAGFRRHEFVIPDDPSLQDLVLAIKSEREAREAAMADQQKHLDWRFVHFAEDFNLRIEQVEQRMDQSAEDRFEFVNHSCHVCKARVRWVNLTLTRAGQETRSLGSAHS
ncbi:unnamed protein product [Effrenium voratum]|nr:unnamed protein product [Effrenium voratum]